MKIPLYTLACLCWSLTLHAQHSTPDATIPQVGKLMVEFTLYDIEHPTKSKVTLEDYKGKWLFLDFWYRGCVTCLNSLQKVNDLQQHYKNKIHFLLVGVNGQEMFGTGVRQLYERLREKKNWQLTVTYDSVLNNRWNIYSFPHIIIVDPKGMVRAITDGQDMTIEEINALLEGKDVAFHLKDVVRPPFDPVLTGLSNDSLLYRSQLSQWNGERQSIPDIYGMEKGCAGIRASRIPLEGLYTLAFLGKSQWLPNDSLYLQAYRYPVWEVEDKNIMDFDYETGKGIYNYELTMPAPKSKTEIMNVMQLELYNTFGFEASLEERWMPVWKLVASKGASEKLKTKGGKPGFDVDVQADGGAGGFGFKNYPVSALLNILIRFAPKAGIPYIDETNFTHNIDIEMDVVMMDEEAVKRELKRNGLDLIMSKRLMRVVVIRDRKMNN